MPQKTDALIYENNYKIAHALEACSGHLGLDFDRYTLRPYNQFKPSNTTWWLVPSTEWPAYRFGKFFVRRYGDDRAPMIGYYVEHGLTPQLRGLPGLRPKFIMDHRWYWHDFMDQMKDGSLDDPYRQTHSRAGLPVVVRLESFAFNRVPDYDHPEENVPDDVLEFGLDRLNPTLRMMCSADAVLSPMRDCDSFSELARRLTSLNDLEYYWIDLYIGVRLDYGTPETGSWDAAQTWNRILEPWKAFVR
jgi:hypothetical protein